MTTGLMSAGDWVTLAREMLKVAREEVGTREDPPGSNLGPITKYMVPKPGPAVTHGPDWCAYFSYWVLMTAASNTKNAIASDCSLRPRVLDAKADCETMGYFHRQEPRAGEFAFYLSGHHMGVVTGYDRVSGLVHTIEGNVSTNAVATRHSPKSAFSGFGCPFIVEGWDLRPERGVPWISSSTGPSGTRSTMSTPAQAPFADLRGRDYVSSPERFLPTSGEMAQIGTRVSALPPGAAPGLSVKLARPIGPNGRLMDAEFFTANWISRKAGVPLPLDDGKAPLLGTGVLDPLFGSAPVSTGIHQKQRTYPVSHWPGRDGARWLIVDCVGEPTREDDDALPFTWARAANTTGDPFSAGSVAAPLLWLAGSRSHANHARRCPASRNASELIALWIAATSEEWHGGALCATTVPEALSIVLNSLTPADPFPWDGVMLWAFATLGERKQRDTAPVRLREEPLLTAQGVREMLMARQPRAMHNSCDLLVVDRHPSLVPIPLGDDGKSPAMGWVRYIDWLSDMSVYPVERTMGMSSVPWSLVQLGRTIRERSAMRRTAARGR